MASVSRRYSRYSWIAIWSVAAVGIARIAPRMPNRVLPKRTATRTTNASILVARLIRADHVVLDLLVDDCEHHPDDQQTGKLTNAATIATSTDAIVADHRDQVEHEHHHRERARERHPEDGQHDE